LQIYVLTSAISDTANTPVIATYDDAVNVGPDAHPNSTLFIFATGKHLSFESAGQVLLPSWRDDLDDVIDFEAARRIDIPFAPYKQRNATRKTQEYNAAYGMEQANWPPEAVAGQNEINRGWNYVNQVRSASNNLKNTAPLNPCDDSNWPATIPPITVPV
jgi:hypothetical protein